MERERIVERGAWAGPTHLVLMAWLLLSAISMPHATGYSPASQAFWNSVAVAALVGVTSVRSMFSTSAAEYGLHALLGAWLLVAPIALQYPDTSVGMNTMAVGLVMAFTGMFAAAQRVAAADEPR